MSDNPDSEDILRLSTETDDSGFDAFNAQIDALAARIAELQNEAYGAFDKGNESAYEYIKTLDGIKEATFADTANLNDLTKQVDAVTASYEKLGSVATGTNGALTAGNNNGWSSEMLAGYGVSGGMIGPSLPPNSSGTIDEGGGGAGSLFGVARGIRGAAGLERIAGLGSGAELTGGADILYMVQGFRQLESVLSPLNESITASLGPLGGLAEGLTALGVPMAGLVAVALPVGAALLGLGAAVSAFANTIKQGNDAVDAAEKALEKHFEVATTGTTESITKQIASQHDLKAAKEADIEFNRNLLNQQIADAGQRAGRTPEDIARYQKEAFEGKTSSFDLNLPVDTISGIHSLVDVIKKLKGESETADTTISHLSSALGTATVAANDAVAADQKQAEDDLKRNQQYAADDNLTAKAANDRATALKADIANQIQAIDTLERHTDALDPDSQAYLDNQAQIAQHSKALQDDKDELKHVTDESLLIIAARQAEADAIKATSKALDDIAKAHDQLVKGVSDAETQLANQTETAKARELQAEQQYAEGSIQDIYARNRIATEEGRKEVAAKQESYNRITDMQIALTNKENQLSTDFDRQITDDRTKFYGDWDKLNRTSQETAREDLIQHLQKIQDLQTKQDGQQQNDLLNRNFLHLLEAKNSQNDAIKQENLHYERQELALGRHLGDQENELIIHLGQEEAQQRLGYERKFADMQTAERQQELIENRHEQNKLTQLQTAEQQQLADLTTNEQYKTQILQQGLKNEVQLYALAEQQRIAIIQETTNAMMQAAISAIAQQAASNPLGAFLGGMSWLANGGDIVGAGKGLVNSALGFPLLGYAKGGDFEANRPFAMSEGDESETLNIGGGAWRINNAALVMPLQSGSVTPPAPSGGSSSGRGPIYLTVAPVFNDAGQMNPQQMVHLIREESLNLINQVSE